MATIIKAASEVQHVSAPEIRTATFDLVDLTSRADEYVEAVRREASKLVQEAHRQAGEVRRSAEEAGRHAALDAANRVLDAKVAQRMKTILPALQQAVQEIADQQANWRRQSEAALVRLAILVAERLVRRQIRECPEIPLTWVRESLELAVGAARITLRLHPLDVEGLGSQVERLIDEIGRLAPARILADEAIGRGGCQVQTEFGAIDMQLATQLQRIEEELLGE
jgi:flagellar biosynthesis/type III secretory pathway protein FliH